MSLQYFFPSSENIELVNSLIKACGVEVCRNKISHRWINSSLSNLSFGYIAFNVKAQVGRRSLKKNEDKHSLYGFIICRIDKDAEICWIDLVCSKIDSKIGKLLMETAEEEIRKIKTIKQIQLIPLSDEKLKNWYTELGYKSSLDIKRYEGEPSTYLMWKFL